MSDGGTRTGTWVIRGAIALVAAIVLFFGGLLIYVNFIHDSEPPITRADVDTNTPGQVVELTSPSAETPPVTEPATTPTDTTAATTPTTAAPATGAPAGSTSWAATDASLVGYRIKEILFGVDTEAVGRTNQVAGTLTFDGTTLVTADFTIDMTSVASDDGRRDNQYRQIMSVGDFPTASFVLTEPVEVGIEPTEGAAATASATGELTLRGATRSVTFDLTADVDNGQIVVVGNIPIVFADYGIANPSRAGITTEDNGLLEFALVFTQV
ncbi:MAG TPA: YceI family protein [Ilumatobacter sp.]|nr:YceI family protein [Ilumatobacter sp.]